MEFRKGRKFIIFLLNRNRSPYSLYCNQPPSPYDQIQIGSIQTSFPSIESDPAEPLILHLTGISSVPLIPQAVSFPPALREQVHPDIWLVTAQSLGANTLPAPALPARSDRLVVVISTPAGPQKAFGSDNDQ